jgi:hypothetical protein
MDHDAGLAALSALAATLEEAGRAYPHRLALAPNTGRPTGIDLDGDGRSHRARDAQGFGYFTGDGGMALLSHFPIGEVRDFTTFLWADLPGSTAATVTPEAALGLLRLHSVGAWDVEILTPSGPFHVLASHASAPVFDGPEDRNGLRNADEIGFWRLYLDGWTPEGPPFVAEAFAVAGTLNVDPDRGEGRREALEALLAHPLLSDPEPLGAGGTATAYWERGPGALRVDYILPGRSDSVVASGVLWPDPDAPLMGVTDETARRASAHRLVWMDLAPPAPAAPP